MNCKKSKLLCASLTIAMLLSVFSVFNAGVAQARPSVYIDPKDNIFFTDTTPVGSTFTVSIKTADWVNPGVFSYQLKVFFNTAMLNVTAAGMGVGHFLTPVNPSKIFVVDDGLVDYEAGSVSFAATLLNPEAPKTGSGTLATITFKIIAAPPSGQTLSSLIELKDKDTKMVDSNADEIPKASYDKISGNFQYSAPPPPLYLTIQPSKVVAAKIGDIVTINVDIKLVETDLQVVAVQFKLSFDPAILSITSANIVEGGFFKGFGTTFFVSVTGDDYAKVGVLLLPTADGDYPPTASGFPSGNGTLATLSFTVKGLPQTPTEFPLTISGAKILDSSVSNVPPRRLESGILLAPTRFEDLNGDGAIDIQDLTIWGLAFGSSPTGPTSTRWDPRADLDHNDIINILDGVKIAIVFGT